MRECPINSASVLLLKSPRLRGGKIHLRFFRMGAIPDGTLSSRRVVPHPSSPIYLNVTIWVQNRRFELKLGPNRSVSVQITIQTIQNH